MTSSEDLLRPLPQQPLLLPPSPEALVVSREKQAKQVLASERLRLLEFNKNDRGLRYERPTEAAPSSLLRKCRGAQATRPTEPAPPACCPKCAQD